MFIWHLKRHDIATHEETVSLVVVADDEITARILASDHAGVEGPGLWLSGIVSAVAIGAAFDSHAAPHTVCVNEVEA